MYTLYTIFGVYGFLRSFVSNLSILKSVKILKKKYKETLSFSHKSSFRKYFILIPLLREQELIPEIFKVFSNLSGQYELVFITTYKEEFEHNNDREKFKSKIIKKLLKCKSDKSFLETSLGYFYKGYANKVYKVLRDIPNDKKESFLLRMYNQKPLTKDLLERELENCKKKNIKILEYPKSKGVMAHQLNYACKWIRDNHPNQNNMVCIYNADSVIQRNYIKILNHIQGDTIQQSSLFLRNFQNPSTSLREAFLKGNGMLQSRWTLAHEIPRIYSQRKENVLNFLELSHVVGHGLAINLNVLKKVGDFPTEFSNEDLPLGYMLRINNEFVDIYPILENSETPFTPDSVFTQYRTWFYGVAYYPKYFLYALNNFQLSFKYKVYGFVWAMRGIFRSLQWLLTSLYWLFILLYPLLILDLRLFSIALTSFLFYSLLGWYLTFVSIKKCPEIFPDNKRLRMNVLDWFAIFPVYLTHSWGLILGSVDILKKTLMGININKRKTER